MKISELQPSEVFRFFEDICAIPHGSGNTAEISRYLERFARDRNLYVRVDEIGNVIMKKAASAGYENHSPVILQGHMDMVAVKEEGIVKDLSREGLDLYAEDGFLKARGTSLGGDDGIAVAYGLALLDGDYEHPPVELVITVDEETGMEGAANITVHDLEGTRMINLDEEEEDKLLVGCAGGAVVEVMFRPSYEQKEGKELVIRIEGLNSGHSGVDIHRGYANAIVLMGRVLSFLAKDGAEKQYEYDLISLSGGSADNVIPKSACAKLLFNADNWDKKSRWIQECVEKCAKQIQEEYEGTEEHIHIFCNSIPSAVSSEYRVMSTGSRDNYISFLRECPNGVIAMTPHMDNMVETSLNIGVLKEEQDALCLEILVRSSVDTKKDAVVQRIREIAEMLNASCVVKSAYSGWSYKEESPLRDKMCEIYERRYGHKPIIESIHAGLECGMFCGKIKDLDCVSIGPNILDIHTTKERLEIASAERTWNYLLEVLKEL